MRCAWRPGLQVRYGEVNTWRGFDAGCRSGFMWESCSGSLLTAVKVAGSDDLYQLECLPQGSRTSCEFMQIWGDLGVEFVDVLPGSQEFDEEPDWGTIEDRLSRPRSGC